MKNFLILLFVIAFLTSCSKKSTLEQEVIAAVGSTEIPLEGIILNQTFETSLTTGFTAYEYPSNNSNAMLREMKDGDYAVKVTLRSSDSEAQWGGTRTELTNNNSSDKTRIDSTHRWWSANFYFPSTYLYDRGDEIIMQWHDKSPNCSTSPAYSLHIIRDSLAVNIRYSTQDYCNFPSSRKIAVDNKGILKLPKERWFNLQTYYDPYVGKIIVWVDGIKLYEYSGPCHYIGSWHPYFKIGLYKWQWNGSGVTDVSSRQFWMDDVKIARGELTTDTVIVEPPVNSAPIVNAGGDITTRNTQVSLNGEATDDKDSVLTNYKWSQISGPSIATISEGWNPTISNLSLGTYTFRLTVVDSEGLSGYDDVIVKRVRKGKLR